MRSTAWIRWAPWTGTRRDLLRGAGALGAGLAAPAIAALLAEPVALPVGLRRSGLVPRDDAARALGRRYLARRPGEATPAWLWQRLAGEPLEAGPPLAWSAADWRRRVVRAQREDRAAGRCLELDGWLVTVTEARLLALASWS